jgi:(1->4)-alpha-D-glucan 1-alpha-D-glucosylmutase
MRIPLSTYRVQINPAFKFKEAHQIVVYLSELGISDIYASPIFKARKGSTHGYDITDPNQLNPEIGGKEDFEELMREVKKCGMGWVQDIVPNHMAYTGENLMLMDILESGQGSVFFDTFDIEWNHPYESLKGKLLAPFLGRINGECLEKGEIKLRYDQSGLTFNYYSLRFPLKIESYGKVFTHDLGILKKKLGSDHPDLVKLFGVLYTLKNLPSREENNERYDQIRFVKRMLWELYTKNPEIKSFIDGNIDTFNGKEDNPDSFNLLENLLSEQLFRLSFWKVATEEINYRRFFNINELISLRIEDQDVFNHIHAFIFQLIEEKKITGLRIDHIDGLYDPTGYLKSVRERAEQIYIIVEKILAHEEELPPFWPVQGTTGYDFLNYVNGIFCKSKNEIRFDKIYATFTDFKVPYQELVSEKKRLIVGKHMAGDVDNLAHLLKRISSRDRHGSDITLYGLKRALVEFLAYFPVYRTYISHELFSHQDQSYIRKVIEKVKEKNPGLLYELDFIEKFLLLKFKEYISEEEKRQWIHFVMRFQQFTGPLMAKGFEDTTLYIYNRLISLNEVGGSPNIFGISMKTFHAFNTRRAHLWAHTMNTTATHDTKKGEDVRARINVISEIPEEWEKTIRHWIKMNRVRKRLIDGKNVPDRNDEYFLYQTLIGAFPFYDADYPVFIERIKNYIIKAVREAKVHTGWLKPDLEYENAFIVFIEDILTRSDQNEFPDALLAFQRRIAHYGILNSLSQTLIKITSPGVPDFYQGTELWDLNLVDPDNRRPVDFGLLKKYLGEIRDRAHTDLIGFIGELLSTKEDGRVKLFLIQRALLARESNKAVFQEGAYLPLKLRGRWKKHIVCFARLHDYSWTITVAPRFLTGLIKVGEYPLGPQVWDDTAIVIPRGAPKDWQDAITSRFVPGERTLRISDILRNFPVALLTGKENP